jgi:hypothetical protein
LIIDTSKSGIGGSKLGICAMTWRNAAVAVLQSKLAAFAGYIIPTSAEKNCGAVKDLKHRYFPPFDPFLGSARRVTPERS